MRNKTKRTVMRDKLSRGKKADNRKLVNLPGYERKEEDSPNFIPRVQKMSLGEFIQKTASKSDEAKGIY